MATIEVPVTFTLPDTSGDVYQQPWSLVDGATTIDGMVWMFNDSGNTDELYGQVWVPQDYVGTPKWKIFWTGANVTTNSVVWEVDYLARSASEDLGGAPTTGDTVTDAHTGTADQLNIAEISSTAGNYAAGDLVLISLARASGNGSDNFGSAAALWGMLFQYSDA